jgi:hypothetical protein
MAFPPPRSQRNEFTTVLKELQQAPVWCRLRLFSVRVDSISPLRPKHHTIASKIEAMPASAMVAFEARTRTIASPARQPEPMQTP